MTMMVNCIISVTSYGHTAEGKMKTEAHEIFQGLVDAIIYNQSLVATVLSLAHKYMKLQQYRTV